MHRPSPSLVQSHLPGSPNRTMYRSLEFFADGRIIRNKTQPKLELRNPPDELSQNKWRDIAKLCVPNLAPGYNYVKSLSVPKRWQLFAAVNDVWTDELSHILELTEGHLQAQARYSRRPARILDAGASTGCLTLPLICQGHQVVALEPNPFMYRQLLSNARDEVPAKSRSRLQIVYKKLEEYDARGRSFDVIHSRTVMHTFSPDLMQEFAQALYDNLAPGGLAVVSGLQGMKSGGDKVIDSVQIYLREHNLENKLWLFHLYCALGADLFPDQHSSTHVMLALKKAGFEKLPIFDHHYYHGMGYLIAAQKKGSVP